MLPKRYCSPGEKRKTIDADEDRVAPPIPTVAEVGEFGVIERATKGRTQSEHTLLGPGDDAALVAAPDGRVVATTDMLVHGRHFRFDWSDPVDVGRKAIAQNGADVAAMGARCTGFLVALACPSDTPVDVTDGIFDGLSREAALAGASVVGGDLVSSDVLVISITALGDLEGRDPVLRSGARPGDVVAVAGRLGWSAGGFAVLDAGLPGHRNLTAAHRVPRPQYNRGAEAAIAGATSLTDVSDGLLADLGHIAEASSVAIDLDSDAFVVGAELRSAADELGVSALSWILAGGEDHAFAATYATEDDVPDDWVVVGRVTGPASEENAPTVTVDGASHSGATGWSSFQD